MKIAHFTDAYPPNVNGVAVVVEVFARKLSREHQVEVYAPAYTGRGGVEKIGNLTIRRYRSVALPTYKDFRLAVPSVTGVAESFEAFDPDVVHFHTPGPLGMLGILLSKSRKKSLVGTYHTLLSETLVYASPKKLLEKYLPAIDRAASGLGVDLKLLGNGENKNGGEQTLPQKMVWGLANRIYGYADVTLCPSQAIKREVIARGMKGRVGVLSNGIELPKFPVKTEYKNRQRILHTGRLGFEKNIGVVIKAFARVGQKYPDARLTIAGDGPARKELEKVTRDMVVEDKVRFLGMVKREKLAEIYREHDMFVTASAMETQGLVVLEAMASGLPVVAVNKYALPDLVKNWRNGFLVGVGDDRGMASRIMKLINDGTLTERMGREARKTAGEHDLDKVIERLEEIYEQLPVCKDGGWWQRMKSRLGFNGWV
jgi:glycosyltransferase involved in cell wall biosynthesis